MVTSVTVLLIVSIVGICIMLCQEFSAINSKLQFHQTSLLRLHLHLQYWSGINSRQHLWRISMWSECCFLAVVLKIPLQPQYIWWNENNWLYFIFCCTFYIFQPSTCYCRKYTSTPVLNYPEVFAIVLLKFQTSL